ncbi:hypothetical protein SNEBB_011131 [Seison nebaliae]|nr:hypothetical protein SNEBB_011131 [Seison nebaliae]
MKKTTFPSNDLAKRSRTLLAELQSCQQRNQELLSNIISPKYTATTELRLSSTPRQRSSTINKNKMQKGLSQSKWTYRKMKEKKNYVLQSSRTDMNDSSGAHSCDESEKKSQRPKRSVSFCDVHSSSSGQMSLNQLSNKKGIRSILKKGKKEISCSNEIESSENSTVLITSQSDEMIKLKNSNSKLTPTESIKELKLVSNTDDLRKRMIEMQIDRVDRIMNEREQRTNDFLTCSSTEPKLKTFQSLKSRSNQSLEESRKKIQSSLKLINPFSSDNDSPYQSSINNNNNKNNNKNIKNKEKEMKNDQKKERRKQVDEYYKRILEDEKIKHQCIHGYSLDGRFFPKPTLADENGESICPICRNPKVAATRENPQYLRISFPKARMDDLNYERNFSHDRQKFNNYSSVSLKQKVASNRANPVDIPKSRKKSTTVFDLKELSNTSFNERKFTMNQAENFALHDATHNNIYRMTNETSSPKIHV